MQKKKKECIDNSSYEKKNKWSWIWITNLYRSSSFNCEQCMPTWGSPLSVMFRHIPIFKLESLEQEEMDIRPAERQGKYSSWCGSQCLQRRETEANLHHQFHYLLGQAPQYNGISLQSRQMLHLELVYMTPFWEKLDLCMNLQCWQWKHQLSCDSMWCQVSLNLCVLTQEMRVPHLSLPNICLD